MKINFAVCVSLALSFQAFASEDIAYKWSDEQRHVHYSQVKPALDMNIFPVVANHAELTTRNEATTGNIGGIAYKWDDQQRHVHYTQAKPSPEVNIEKVIIYNRNALLAKVDRELDVNGKSSSSEVRSDLNGNKDRQIFSGNVTANDQLAKLQGVIDKENSQQRSPLDWYKAVSSDAEMVFTSLTGRFVATDKEGSVGGGDSNYDFIPPCLKLKDFIEGGKVQVYQCSDAKCANPPGTNTMILVGIRDRVRRALIGTGKCADCTGGVLRGLSDGKGDAELSEVERQLIRVSSPEVQALLIKLASKPEAVRMFSEQMADDIAVEMTRKIIDELLDKLREAANSAGRALDMSVQEVQRDLSQQINEQQRAASESIAATSSSIDLYSKAEAELHDRSSPGRALFARQQ